MSGYVIDDPEPLHEGVPDEYFQQPYEHQEPYADDEDLRNLEELDNVNNFRQFRY